MTYLLGFGAGPRVLFRPSENGPGRVRLHDARALPRLRSLPTLFARWRRATFVGRLPPRSARPVPADLYAPGLYGGGSGGASNRDLQQAVLEVGAYPALVYDRG